MEEREELEKELIRVQIEVERAQQRLVEEQIAEIERRKKLRKEVSHGIIISLTILIVALALTVFSLIWVVLIFLLKDLLPYDYRHDICTWVIYGVLCSISLYLFVRYVIIRIIIKKARKKIKDKEQEENQD